MNTHGAPVASWARFGALTLALAISAMASPLAAQELAGRWVLSVDLGPAGGGDASFVFAVEGNQITGTYSGAVGDHDLTGTIEDGVVRFSFNADEVGVVDYEGTIEGDTMTGECTYGALGDGIFTGRRLPDEATP